MPKSRFISSWEISEAPGASSSRASWTVASSGKIAPSSSGLVQPPRQRILALVEEPEGGSCLVRLDPLAQLLGCGHHRAV